jgi:hypothetical protein
MQHASLHKHTRKMYWITQDRGAGPPKPCAHRRSPGSLCLAPAVSGTHTCERHMHKACQDRHTNGRGRRDWGVGCLCVEACWRLFHLGFLSMITTIWSPTVQMGVAADHLHHGMCGVRGRPHQPGRTPPPHAGSQHTSDVALFVRVAGQTCQLRACEVRQPRQSLLR